MDTILKNILNVSNQTLDSLNTSFINQYNFYHDISYFHLQSGREHYRILMYVSTLFTKQLLYDIGTYRCMSAAALSFSMQNKIKTYDIKKVLPINPFLPYVEYNIGNVILDTDLIKSPFIFLDTQHDGIFENILYNHLHSIKWKGFLLLDDIYSYDEMKVFWNDISDDKYDLTYKGHWAGTGLVHFK